MNFKVKKMKRTIEDWKEWSSNSIWKSYVLKMLSLLKNKTHSFNLNKFSKTMKAISIYINKIKTPMYSMDQSAKRNPYLLIQLGFNWKNLNLKRVLPRVFLKILSVIPTNLWIKWLFPIEKWHTAFLQTNLEEFKPNEIFSNKA